MKQSPSWEANSFQLVSKTPHILWKQQVHWRFYKCPSLVPILCRWISSHPYIHFIHIHFNIPLPSESMSHKWSLPLRFCRIKCLYESVITPIRATYLSHFILLNLISLIIFGKKVKVKLSLCLTKYHATKAYLGSGYITPLILWPRH
jgi:hypothetical protein